MQLNKIKLLLFSILLISSIRVAEAATVTASARQYTAANSEYHSIADNASLSATTYFAVEAWVYRDSAADQVIASKWNASAATEWAIQVNTSGSMYVFIATTSTDVGGTLQITSTTPLSSTATWYHVFVIYDGSQSTAADRVKIWVNGSAIATSPSGTLPTSIQNTSAQFRWGAFSGGLTRYWNGRIGPRAFWTGGSRTASESYNSGNGQLYKDVVTKTGLVSWWDGAETSGVLIDAHGTNNLTDNNTVTSAAGKVTYTAEDASDFTASNSETLSISNASQSGLKPSSGTSFYIAAWVYFDISPNSGNAYGIVGKGDNQVATNIDYKLSVYNNRANMTIGNNSSLFSADATNGPTFSANTWYFVEGYYDNSGAVVGVSVNRSTDNTTAFTGTRDTSTWDFIVGNMGNTAQYWDGRLCSIVFISGGIPTTADRDALFNRGFGVDYSDKPTLSSGTYVSWWELTESSGTRVDSFGNNNLTDNNTVTGANGVIYDTPTASIRRIL